MFRKLSLQDCIRKNDHHTPTFSVVSCLWSGLPQLHLERILEKVYNENQLIRGFIQPGANTEVFTRTHTWFCIRWFPQKWPFLTFCPPINMIWTVTWIGDSWPCCTLFCQSFSIQLFNGLVFQYCSTLNFIMIFIPPMKMILMSTYRGARWRGWKKGKRDNNACVFFAIPMTIFSRVQRMRRLQKI